MDDQTISYLRYAHTLYNFCIFALFCYQGVIGFGIRRLRAESKPTFKRGRRHTGIGHVLIVLGAAGFVSGLALVYLDVGNFLEYPSHLSAGIAAMFSTFAAYLASKKIHGSTNRGKHSVIGILTLALYLITVFIGLGVLF